MGLSVTQAVDAAFRQMKWILFEPFSLEKWLGMGFCAWLAMLGEGGGPQFPQFGRGGRGGGGGKAPDELMRDGLAWVQMHLVLVVAIAVAVLLIVAAVLTLIQWLNSRGQFMLLDGMANNRGLVAQPWREYRAEGNSLFWFRVWAGLVMLLIGAAAILLLLGIAWPDLLRLTFGERAKLAIVAAVLVLPPIMLVTMLFYTCLRDFVVPIMYLRRCSTVAAWGIFRDEVVRGNLGALVLFFLMQFLLTIGVIIASVMAICFTCFLALLPYVGTVVLLPLILFLRAYPLCFLEQLGPQWKFFQDFPPPATGFEVIPREPA